MNVEDGNHAKIWFQLFSTRGIGPKKLISIAEQLERYQFQPENLPFSHKGLTESPELVQIIGDKLQVEETERINTEYEKLQEGDITIIYPGHPDAPSLSREVSPVLFIKGRPKLLISKGVAIVGSRNVSDGGVQIAKKVAAELANRGINVVSGYSKGVDSTAHLSALEAGGTTTLVLPYGINELRRKREFKKYNWKQDVLAVSQFSPDAKWLARNAMVRNKLICALSKAVVVIESGPERDAEGRMSGTFDTGKTALDMKIPLFVVDPEYFEDSSTGNADLIALGGRKLDSSDGAAEVVNYLKMTQPTKSGNVPINIAAESFSQLNLFN